MGGRMPGRETEGGALLLPCPDAHMGQEQGQQPGAHQGLPQDAQEAEHSGRKPRPSCMSSRLGWSTRARTQTDSVTRRLISYSPNSG